MNKSHAELRAWVDAQWPYLQVNDFELSPEFHGLDESAPGWQALGGDAGFRQYFRLASIPPLLAVNAPPAQEDMGAFIRVAKFLRGNSVNVPAIAAYDESRGFMIIEDLGATLLSEKLSEETVDSLYVEALEDLLKIQQAPVDLNIMPQYSRQLLRAEMELFPQWFVSELLGISPSEKDRTMLDKWFTLLENLALEQPQVTVHRDFHSRNLVIGSGSGLGVIDFQDAVVGPFTYDLVSLLRDCYVQWPQDKVRAWAYTYLETVVASGIVKPIEVDKFYRWFDAMGLQRHIKVLGIFARLSLRDGKHSYLNDLSLTIEYVRNVSEQYQGSKKLDSSDFLEWFDKRLMPVIKDQPWYNSQQKAMEN